MVLSEAQGEIYFSWCSAQLSTERSLLLFLSQTSAVTVLFRGSIKWRNGKGVF